MPRGRCPHCKREQNILSTLSITQHCQFCHKPFKSEQDRSYMRRDDSSLLDTIIVAGVAHSIAESFDSGSSGGDSGNSGGFDSGGGGDFGGGGASGDF